jgi:uncharacterized protein
MPADVNMAPVRIRSLPAACLVLALAPTGYVIDRGGLLNATTVAALDATLYQHEVETSNQVVVETVASLQGTPIEEYSLRRAGELGIGQKAKDNGVLVVVSRDDRKVRIEVGYGLEGVLPDAICARIIRLEMTPRFREGSYDDGVTAGVEAILGAIRGEYKATPLDRLQAAVPAVSYLAPLLDGSVFRNVPSVVQIVVGVFFWIFSAVWLFAGPVLGRVAGQPIRLGILPGLVVSALVVYAFPYTLVPLGVFAMMAIVNLFAPESARNHSRRGSGGSSSGGSWSSSGSSSGSSYSSGSSSGGGSFSGGGGSFGGGGASGSW